MCNHELCKQESMTSLMKCTPWSLTISKGSPYLVKIFSYRKIAVVQASFLGVAFASTHFVR